ncbi:MAG TPA: HipA N-terminal domain-containing protein [Clostridia bacterium]|nr:HipA N-terminal domain-containing protein [Clostridia bacterium]HPQ46168.1 HipA N-terminal domain-containing protein [Clostridia bacterium]
MPLEFRKGYVYIQNIYAGIIEETDEGYRFSYDSAYFHNDNSIALSLTLPLDKIKYDSPVLFPFFDGLIPEGWILGIVSKNWKIDINDRFGLLLVACKDCIGDVSIRKEV